MSEGTTTTKENEMTHRAMYERVYGDKYQKDEWLSAAQISKSVKADIKEALKTGVLPGTIKDYSVTSQTYAGGRSVNVTLINHDHYWIECGTESFCSQFCPKAKWGEDSHLVLSEEGRAVEKTLNWMLGRYNFDGSEIQVDYFDVNFYGHASIEDARGKEWRLAEAARKAQNKADAKAKKELIAHIVGGKHGSYYKAGRLRQSSYAKLVAAHAKWHEGDKDHAVEDLTA